MRYIIFLVLGFTFVGCVQQEDPKGQKPSNLEYSTSTHSTKMGSSFQSVTPAIDGDTPISYSITKVTELLSSNDVTSDSEIVIDEQTGVLSLGDGNGQVAGSYSIDITATNEAGSTSFNGAYTITIAELMPPQNLTYNPNSILIEEGEDFSSVEPTLEGTAPYTFSLANTLDIGSFISINGTTGVISVDGETSEIGEYSLDIDVSNDDGSTSFLSVYTIIIEEHTVDVSDGYYLALQNEDPISDHILISENVSGSSFDSQARAGFVANYMYLDHGTYTMVNVNSHYITNIYGGTTSTVPMTADCGPQSYTLITPEENTDGFAVEAGLYKVSYDETLNEIVLFEIEQVGLIGSSTENGWASSIELPSLTVATATGAAWQMSDFLLFEGAFKLRLNCSWYIDRRIDQMSDFSSSNGYATFTNFGGTPDFLQNGNDGPNIEVFEKDGGTPDEGYYTVTVEWSPSEGFTLDLERTADYVFVFDPNDYQWGIIGDATAGGWTTDTDLSYEGLTGSTYSWSGTFDLLANDFKFRTNDSWDLGLGYNDASLTGDLGDISENGGNFHLSSAGNYTITISTGDEGASWSVNFQKN